MDDLVGVRTDGRSARPVPPFTGDTRDRLRIMPLMAWRGYHLIWILSLVLGLAACGGVHDSSAPTASGNKDGPLGSDEFGLTREQLVSRVEGVEDLIGKCMAAAGFEYVPVDFATMRSAMTSDKSAPGLSQAEFYQQYGYGITTQFDKPIVRLGLGEENLRLREALSEADRIAYDRTLLGDDPEAVFAYALEAEDFSRTGGCTRQAVEEQFSAEEVAQTYFNPVDALVLEDARVISALATFASCMQSAGYEYSHPDEAEQDLLDRLDAVTEGADPSTLTGPALDALTALQDYERAVVPVAVGCETTHLEPVIDTVERELLGR